jgi:type II secretion system protein G
MLPDCIRPRITRTTRICFDTFPSSSRRSHPSDLGSPASGPRERPCSCGFTLIELLVVIAIILLLMGLLFPVLRGAQNQAKKAQAKNDLAQIVTAVNAYYTDYGTYPLNSGNNGGGADTVYGDPNGTYSSADLFDALRAIPDGAWNNNNQLNTRQVVYFNGANVKDASNPRAGFETGTATVTNSKGYSIRPGSYVDPWGDEYVVFIDADYNGDIMQSLGWFYTDYSSGSNNTVRTGVGAASLGEDQTWGTNSDHRFTGSDDIGSWQ